MGSIDTRLHELEARVAALEWWKSFHIEQRHAGEAGGPEPAASYRTMHTTPKQAARPAPPQCSHGISYDAPCPLCGPRQPAPQQPRGGGG